MKKELTLCSCPHIQPQPHIKRELCGTWRSPSPDFRNAFMADLADVLVCAYAPFGARVTPEEDEARVFVEFPDASFSIHLRVY